MNEDDVSATTWDPHGRAVVLLRRLWTGKILRDHPERHAALADVLLTVREPHITRPAREARRVRYLRADSGPSRWLLVVVSYEQKPARIITAFGQRKDPAA
jgi:hypothetical protein